MVKYIGSKRVLVPRIVDLVGSLRGVATVLDAFSGTARVSHALKSHGLHVIANDHNTYAYVLARCYVQANRDRVLSDARRLLAELNSLPGAPGWFTETYCVRSRYFMPHNGARIEAIRNAIAAKDLDPDLEAVLLVSLMEAADRVDSTTGVQMAYLKHWAPRARQNLELRLPQVLPGNGLALQCEAIDAVRAHDVDLVYLDPPYNQHSYRGNYHIWETLVRWDQPEVYGVACKRLDCRSYHSPYNSKRQIHAALSDVVREARCRYLLVSFNNEGYVRPEDLERMLAARGLVQTIEVDFRRYVGAQIGIFNPQGERVGKVSHLRNKEHLYLVSCEGTEPPAELVVEKRGQLALF